MITVIKSLTVIITFILDLWSLSVPFTLLTLRLPVPFVVPPHSPPVVRRERVRNRTKDVSNPLLSTRLVPSPFMSLRYATLIHSS